MVRNSRYYFVRIYQSKVISQKGIKLIYCFDLDEISVAEFCAPLINIVSVLYRKSIDVIADRAISSYRRVWMGGGGGLVFTIH